MSRFKRKKHNPIELINEFWPGSNLDHITYEPEFKEGEYNIIRQCGGDGTLLFTIEMMQKALINIVNQQSFFTKTEPNWNELKGIKYTIGSIKHVTVFGKIKLKCSKTQKYNGQLERVRMPVKCEYIYV